jgi:hypothetical protein
MFDKTTIRPSVLPYKEPRLSTYALLAAMSLMVFTRRNIGWRLIQPGKLSLLAFALGFSPNSEGSNSALFWVGNFGVTGAMLFGASVVALALRQYYVHRGRGAFAPGSQHAYHSGDPYLGFLPLRRVYIVTLIEPLLVFFVGWSLFDQGLPLGNLGIWLMISAATLALFGFAESRYQVHRLWTDHDLKSEAEAETIAARTRGKRSQDTQDETLHAAAGGEGENPYRRRGR